MRRQLSLHKGVCIQLLKLMMMFGVLYSDLIGPSAEDMKTGESQSIGESVLAHDEFFVRS